MSTLLRIPDIILEAEHKLEIFDNDLALSDKAEELNVAILKALESAVASLKKNPFGELLLLSSVSGLLITGAPVKQGRALGRGQSYNKPFRKKLEDVERALVTLQARADVLRDDAIIRTRRTTDGIQSTVLDVQKVAKS